MVAHTVARVCVLDGLQILVVDDDPDITSLVGEVLVDAGASVVPANNGTAAVNLIMLMTFDLVVLDLGMPHPDGLAVIEFLRATEPGLLGRMLVLTGREYDRDAMARLEAHGIPHLLKPFRLDELVEAASRLSPSKCPSLPAA